MDLSSAEKGLVLECLNFRLCTLDFSTLSDEDVRAIRR